MMNNDKTLTKQELIQILGEMLQESEKIRVGFMESEFKYTCGDTLKHYVELLRDKLPELELRDE